MESVQNMHALRKELYGICMEYGMNCTEYVWSQVGIGWNMYGMKEKVTWDV